MTTSRITYGALIFLFAGICICGCVTDDEAYSSALSHYGQAEAKISEINWDTTPPELTNAKLHGAEVDLNEALVIIDTIQPDSTSEEPSAAYGLREIILGKSAYVSAAREVSSAQVHILNAHDATELYQYDDWYLEMYAAMGSLAIADGVLTRSDTRMDGINMTLVPADMRSKIVETKAINSNFGGLIISMERSVELALKG